MKKRQDLVYRNLDLGESSKSQSSSPQNHSPALIVQQQNFDKYYGDPHVVPSEVASLKGDSYFDCGDYSNVQIDLTKTQG